MAQPPAHVPRPDWPTFYDAIGWQDHLTTLAERIAHCQTPQVFGIHGDWGSGKTSFARQLQFNLGGDPDPGCDRPVSLKPLNEPATTLYQGEIVTVWFEAWRYQNEPVPVVALLQEMCRQLSITKRFKKQFGKMAGVTSRALLTPFWISASTSASTACPALKKSSPWASSGKRTISHNGSAPIPPALCCNRL